MDNFDEKVAEIAEFTDNNNHMDALILGSEFFDDDDYLRNKFVGYKTKSDYGRMMPWDFDARYKLYQEMMACAKASMTEENYNKFYMAF